MKKFRYLIPIIGLALISHSCSQIDQARIPDILKAANVRIQLNPNYSTLRADDISNAKIEFSVFSENKNIDQVELSAQYYNFAGDTLYARRRVKVFKQSDFDAVNGAIKNVTYTSSDLAALFGLASSNDLGGGDRFDFFNVTKLTNGLIFPDTLPLPGETTNLSPAIVNTSATTSFSVGFTIYVACPINPQFGTGDYMLEQISGPDDPFFGNPTRWAPEKVNITAVSPIERTFGGKYFTFDIPFNFLLICGKVLVGTTSSGLSCGGPDLSWKSTNPPGTYNEADDKVIMIQLLDNVDGGCGLPAGEPLTLKLTKVTN